MKYKLHFISEDEATKLKNANGKGWNWICENNHGACCWNNITGELLWIPNGEKAKYSKLVPN